MKREAEPKVSRRTATTVAKKIKAKLPQQEIRQFQRGLKVEQEHKDVTGGKMTTTGKIAVAHLKERPDYYDRLDACVEAPEKKKRRGK